ncbi:matrilin-2 isoform X2 [Hydra vulgaris]|uniref:matrilin-2 isoform X2 n=1 Tax=Hydra vulgaris TaxID=6087 RepID=UPI0032EA5FEC
MVAMYSLIIKICVYGFAICIVTSTDSLTLCFEKNCYSFIYCDLVDGKAVCSCPYGYNLQADNRSCVYDWCSWKSCEYICEVISDQAICSCPNGLYLQADGITCSVDYCKEKSCEYNCEMAFGQAVCSCPYGSFLQADGRSCSFDYCKEKSCEYNCEMAFGQAVCSCPYWSFLQADGRSCSFDYCKEKNCEYSCEMVSDQAVCLCPYGSFLQDDDKSCSFVSINWHLLLCDLTQKLKVRLYRGWLEINMVMSTFRHYFDNPRPSYELGVNNTGHFNMAILELTAYV